MDELTEKLQQLEQTVRRRKRERQQAEADRVHQLSLFEETLPKPNGQPRFPTLFTRLPIFKPVRYRETLDTDWKEGQRIETNWGSVTRFGPGLNCYDEDVLIAIYHLCRQKRLRGPGNRMPVPILSQVQRPGEDATVEASIESVEVLIGETTAVQIGRFLGKDRNGRVAGTHLQQIRESIHRLSLTRLFIKGGPIKARRSTSFFEITDIGESDEAAPKAPNEYNPETDYRGKILFQFSPIALLLLEQYTYINMNVRLELGMIGKAVHKFLSSQPRKYEIRLDKLQDIIGADHIPRKRFKYELNKELEIMQMDGWLESYEFIANADKKAPETGMSYKLKTTRPAANA